MSGIFAQRNAKRLASISALLAEQKDLSSDSASSSSEESSVASSGEGEVAVVAGRGKRGREDETARMEAMLARLASDRLDTSLSSSSLDLEDDEDDEEQGDKKGRGKKRGLATMEERKKRWTIRVDSDDEDKKDEVVLTAPSKRRKQQQAAGRDKPQLTQQQAENEKLVSLVRAMARRGEDHRQARDQLEDLFDSSDDDGEEDEQFYDEYATSVILAFHYRPPNGDPITIHHVKVNVQDEFSIIKRKLAQLVGANSQWMELTFDGRSIKDDDTPRGQLMSDNDVVKAVAYDPLRVDSASSVSSSEESDDQNPEITLKVQNARGGVVECIIRMQDPMGKLMKQYAERMGKDESAFRFTNEGLVVRPLSTPIDLDLEDGFQIDVMDATT